MGSLLRRPTRYPTLTVAWLGGLDVRNLLVLTDAMQFIVAGRVGSDSIALKAVRYTANLPVIS